MHSFVKQLTKYLSKNRKYYLKTIIFGLFSVIFVNVFKQGTLGFIAQIIYFYNFQIGILVILPTMIFTSIIGIYVSKSLWLRSMHKKTYNFVLEAITQLVYIIFLILSVYSYLKDNQNSIFFLLSLLALVFSLRDLFFSFLVSFLSSLIDLPLAKKWAISLAYVASAIFFLFYFNYVINDSQLLILLYVGVFTFYQMLRIGYLSSPISHRFASFGEPALLFSIKEMVNFDSLVSWIGTLILLLYTYQILSISNSQTLYNFYTAMAQIFSSLLGIVAMFGILLLQMNKTDEKSSDILKNGIKGFVIIYMTMIMISITGMLISRTISIGKILFISFTQNLDKISSINLLNCVIFELSISMAPIALLYLYVMIVSFLKVNENISETTLFDY